MMQTRSTSSITSRENAANASEPIAHVTHLSGCALTASQRMSLRLNERWSKCQCVSWSGVASTLDFVSVLVKIYLGNPYTIRKLLFRSFIWFHPFSTCFSFSPKKHVSQNQLNSVGRGGKAPLRGQNREFGVSPRGENYATISHFHPTMTHLPLSLAEVSPHDEDIAANQGRPSLSRDPPQHVFYLQSCCRGSLRLHRPARHHQKHPRIVVVAAT